MDNSTEHSNALGECLLAFIDFLPKGLVATIHRREASMMRQEEFEIVSEKIEMNLNSKRHPQKKPLSGSTSIPGPSF
jgi:hypothetical protein